MGDFLSGGAAWLSAQLRSHAGKPVTYVRGEDSISLLAVPGNKPMRTMSDFGARVDYTMQDWLIAASDLVIGGVRQYPERKDIIDVVEGAWVRRYEVLSPGGDEPAWRWSDPNNVAMRVHTKLIEEGGAC